jgi:hypothetical protein
MGKSFPPIENASVCGVAHAKVLPRREVITLTTSAGPRMRELP